MVNKTIKAYVRYMDTTSRAIGKVVMFFIIGMMGVLIFDTVSRTIFNYPHIWTVEFSQFIMAAYYLLGGCYSLLIGGHVRMDLLYHRWSAKQRAIWDLITVPFLMFYLGILIDGAIKAIRYALEFNQVSYSSWAPPMAPIKIIMSIGILLMLLQVISEFFKDMARARGEEIK